MINDKQIAVVCHIYDLKLSHINRFETTKFAGCLSSIYGGLSLHRGKLHTYLISYLYYSSQGKVKVPVIRYLYSVLQDFPENMGANESTLGTDHLFKLCDKKKHITYQRIRHIISTIQ